VRRRDLIALIGGATVWPLDALGQQTARNPLIGFLYSGVAKALTLCTNAFLEGVRTSERRKIDLDAPPARNPSGFRCRKPPTARALGIDMPRPLLLLANEVIE
jgi:hypothetical protein